MQQAIDTEFINDKLYHKNPLQTHRSPRSSHSHRRHRPTAVHHPAHRCRCPTDNPSNRSIPLCRPAPPHAPLVLWVAGILVETLEHGTLFPHTSCEGDRVTITLKPCKEAREFTRN
jgi:hypothetical protein